MPLKEIYSNIPSLLAEVTDIPRGESDFTDLDLDRPITPAEIEELVNTCQQMRLGLTISVNPTEYGAEISVKQGN